MADGRTILYLHGLASSPRGRKRTLLETRLGPEGLRVASPDLNAPSFRELSFPAIVEAARRAADETGSAVVIGSSLGALAALSLAGREGWDVPLVLLAPALAFSDRWRSKLPDGDPIEMYHHGEEKTLPVRRGFFEEMAAVCADERPPAVPVSVVMGTEDESVPFAQVEARYREWEASGLLRPGSRFHAVHGGDHGLLEFADAIVAAVRERLVPARPG